MSESILEKALLEAEQLEETMKSNAKEILSSTMKEEIHELVKESLSEDDYLKEQEEEEEVDVLDIEDDMMVDEPEMELDMPMDMELSIDDQIEDAKAYLQERMHNIQDEEVLKVVNGFVGSIGLLLLYIIMTKLR